MPQYQPHAAQPPLQQPFTVQTPIQTQNVQHPPIQHPLLVEPTVATCTQVQTKKENRTQRWSRNKWNDDSKRSGHGNGNQNMKKTRHRRQSALNEMKRLQNRSMIEIVFRCLYFK